ncbi:hypothetical protein R1sor_014090 [Riccia sorocarpa]|uniref:protein-S-isoprenylcysteine alpha-carbonyl methylesterase n=1 Tax=Riccia sorocarpa TaxID=122646 RepID=A0ABD3HAB9_9MARC
MPGESCLRTRGNERSKRRHQFLLQEFPGQEGHLEPLHLLFFYVVDWVVPMLLYKTIAVFGGRRCFSSTPTRQSIKIWAGRARFGSPVSSEWYPFTLSSRTLKSQELLVSRSRTAVPFEKVFRFLETETKMRTIAEPKKDLITTTVNGDHSIGQKKTASDYRLSSSFGDHEIVEHELNFPHSKSEGESSSRSTAVMDDLHTKVDIRKLKDEVASLKVPKTGLRNKSVNRQQSEIVKDKQPLLGVQQRKRRFFSVGDGGIVPPPRQHSFRDDVEHAAQETYLVTRLSFRLLRYLGVGYRWITKLLALGLYALFLMPGFLQVGYHYFFSKYVHRSIVYGDGPRNRLDLYRPENTDQPKPVVIFVTGGAWIIGYKAWGSLLGLQLVERDVIVCCIDYRNFPQGGISDMVEDVCTGIGFVINNIAQYGGDPNRIFLAGQSAGSHLAACALVNQAKKEIGQMEGSILWKCSTIKGFLGISGGYNLHSLVDHFHNRGLYRSIFLSVMEGEVSLPLYSPELIVLSDSFMEGIPLLPPMYLFHGTGDYSIPSGASVTFADALRSKGATVKLKLYPDKTHTDVFLQDPMRGGHDVLFEDVLAVVHADDEEAKAKDAQAPLRPRLVPEFLLQLARRISPF